MQREEFQLMGLAATASIELEAFAFQLAGGSAYRVISRYLNKEMSSLTACLDMFKEMRPTEAISPYGDSIGRSFESLHAVAVSFCRRIGLRPLHIFHRLGEVLRGLFRFSERRKSRPNAVMTRQEANPAFWFALIDRVTDMLRFGFAWFRNLALKAESRSPLPMGAVPLGGHCAQFVERADTADGVLVMRLDSGRRVLFNLTAKAWNCILPLLTSDHPLGHASLPFRPQSIFTRHDAEGCETDDGLAGLKPYIHAVGKGRAGTGQYFLAPYARIPNTVG